MKGNFHVQFLGEGVAATSPPYPTPGGAIPGATRPGTPPAPGPPSPGLESSFAITVEDYYAQGEAVLAAAPTKVRKGPEMLRLSPQGYIDEYLNVAGIAGDWKCRRFRE